MHIKYKQKKFMWVGIDESICYYILYHFFEIDKLIWKLPSHYDKIILEDQMYAYTQDIYKK